MRYILLALLLGSCAAAQGGGAPTFKGVDIRSCYDGDTCKITVRLAGINAPEIKGKCPEERALAIKSRDRLRELVRSANRKPDVTILDVGKYNRLIVRVTLPDGRDAGSTLVAEGLARGYDWRNGRKSWCPEGR